MMVQRGVGALTFSIARHLLTVPTTQQLLVIERDTIIESGCNDELVTRSRRNFCNLVGEARRRFEKYIPLHSSGAKLNWIKCVSNYFRSN